MIKHFRSIRPLPQALCLGLSLAVVSPLHAQLSRGPELSNKSVAALPVAQGEFLHRPSVIPGCNGLVTSSAKLANGDVIFGGNFTQCGAVRANRVVRFDGVNFHSVGSGAENGVSGVVRTVYVDGEKIYVGGDFNKAGNTAANNIAVFDGSSWRSVGRGSSNGVANGVVRALQVFENKLYAGGHSENFNQAFLREWNGSSWREVVAFANTGFSDSVNALTVFNGALYFGGTFKPTDSNSYQNLGVFGGTMVSYSDFRPLSPQSFSRVRDLHVFQNQVCVAGTFTLAANSQSGVACRGPTGWQGFGLSAMRALADDGTTLYAAGYDLSGTATVHAIGHSTVIRPERSTEDFVLTLAFQGYGLLLGGSFAQTVTPAHGLLRINAWEFTPLHSGLPPTLSNSFQQFQSAGGTTMGYSLVSQPHPLPSPTLIQRIGSGWEAVALPSGVNLDESQLLKSSESIYLSGSQGKLFKWQSGEWQQRGTNVWVNGSYGDDLIRMDPPDQSGIRRVYRLGNDGLELFLQIPPLRRNGELLGPNQFFLLSLIEFQGKPVIAGQFDFLDGFGPIASVAVFENGSWHQLGGGLSDPKWTSAQDFLQIKLHVHDNQLFAANGFTQAEGAPVDGIARFDGQQWRPLAAGLVQSDAEAGRAQTDLISYHGKLYAFGRFDLADNQAVNNIAQWDGTQWRALGPVGADGIEDPGPFIAAVVGDELHFSGEIHAVGGQPASYYAIWRDELLFASGFE